jgi:hypothetical protein
VPNNIDPAAGEHHRERFRSIIWSARPARVRVPSSSVTKSPGLSPARSAADCGSTWRTTAPGGRTLFGRWFPGFALRIRSRVLWRSVGMVEYRDCASHLGAAYDAFSPQPEPLDRKIDEGPHLGSPDDGPANSNATAGLPLSAPRRRPCVEHPQRRGAGSQPSPQRTRRTGDRISVPPGRSLARAFRAERSWITPHCSPNSDQLASVSRYFCGAAADCVAAEHVTGRRASCLVTYLWATGRSVPPSPTVA